MADHCSPHQSMLFGATSANFGFWMLMYIDSIKFMKESQNSTFFYAFSLCWLHVRVECACESVRLRGSE